MNALEKKEVRLLLPTFIAVLLLETVFPWFFNDPDFGWEWVPVVFFLGIIIVAVDSFGREFHSGTFQMLLSQPVARKQFWRTKMTILFVALALIFASCFASAGLRLHWAISAPLSPWHHNPDIIRSDFWNSMLASATVLFVAASGGLWTTLLFRQLATAFWITFLAPVGLSLAIIFCLADRLSDKTVAVVFEVAAIIYSSWGFWLARRMFYRAQDVGWTGGVIAFTRWRYFESGSESFNAARRRRPVRALFHKEFQLHSIALVGAGILLGLHIVIFILRALYVSSHRNSTVAVLSDFFWVFWLVMPIVIGCMAVAEERKLGVADEQFCLPVSRRRQFLIKFIPTMIFGILIGGVMPLFIEGIATDLGIGNEIFASATHPGNIFGINGLLWFKICVVALSVGFALAAFFASTLARNFLQALSITIITIVGCTLFVGLVAWVNRMRPTFFGITPWHSILPILIALLIVPPTLIRLAYLNFNRFQESRRLWQRNVLGVSGALLFVIFGSTAIYNRAWEIFEPAEPAHGVAKLSLSNPPKINFQVGMTVLLPDGKAWLDYVDIHYSESLANKVRLMVQSLPQSIGPRQLVGGSDWVQIAAQYDKTIGIKSDGTLWASPEPSSPFNGPKKSIPWKSHLELTNFGNETDWQSFGTAGWTVYLLKTNHTLWEWGAHFALRRSRRLFLPPPHQLGTNSDWAEIYSDGWLLRKTDGTVWSIPREQTTNEITFKRETGLDEVNFRTLCSGVNSDEMAYVGKDGRLMVSTHWREAKPPLNHAFLQCGDDTNWAAVSLAWHEMTALKSNGTLWQWKWIAPESVSDAARIRPTRLGIHDDWVAIADSWYGPVTLAADGSLWLWFYPEYTYSEALMKPPKQPEFLGNVLASPR